MAHKPDGPEDAAAREARRSVDNQTHDSPVSPDKIERGEIRHGANVTALLDPANDGAERDLKGPADGSVIAERIFCLNRFFDQASESHPMYRVLTLIGRGGMGAVFKAEQRRPVKRLVAIKLVKPGYDSKEVIARFESERQALARMDHGSVAKVLDAGADDMGRPYFVMEYVPGIAITDFADQNKLSIKQRLELFTGVCSAIAHAHSKSIIHRDIKASNVLACYAEGRPVVKVIDFGIAKALSGDRLTDLTMNTKHGQPLGTYESMSPEQAEGSPDIDTRTDVYSLGALLYELLTGVAPFDRAMFAKAADQEIRRIIREVEPPRPSTRLTSMGGDAGTKVATDRQEPLAALAEELRTELEWIPLMAMRKSRERRYASPLELADDIKRYLEHRPLRAGPESKWYVAKKSLRRHRFAVGAALAVFVSLAAGLIASTYLLGRTLKAEAEVAREVEGIENAMAFGGDEVKDNDPLTARRLYGHAMDELGRYGRVSSAVMAGFTELESSEVGQIPLVGDFGDGGGIAPFRGHERHPNYVAVVPGRFRALSVGDDGWIYLWDLLTGRVIQKSRVEGKPTLTSVAVAADGRFGALAASDGKVRLFDSNTLEQRDVLPIEVTKSIWMVAISPDAKRVVAGTVDGELWRWEKKDRWERARIRDSSEHSESVAGIAFLPGDSRFALVGDGNGQFMLWDLQEGSQVQSFPFEPRAGRDKNINCIAICEDGTKAVTAHFDGTAIIWEVRGSGSSVELVRKYVLMEISGKVWRVAISPDGKKVAVAADQGRLFVYDADTGKRLWQLMSQRRAVNGVAFVDNNTLVSTGDDTMGTDQASLASAIRVWDLSDRGMVLPGVEGGVAKKIEVNDGGQVRVETVTGQSIGAMIGADGRLHAGSADPDEFLRDLPHDYDATMRDAKWSKGGRWTLNAGPTKLAEKPGASQELNVTGGSSLKLFTNGRSELEFRGPVDVAGAGSALMHLRTLRGNTAPVVAVGISPSGRYIVSADERGRILAWDLFRPQLYRRFEKLIADTRNSDESVPPSRQELASLKKWFTFRGRADLAARVSERGSPAE